MEGVGRGGGRAVSADSALWRWLLLLLAMVWLCGTAAPSAQAAPAVVSIVSELSPVQVGQSFYLRVTYDSPMDTTVNPVFSFPTPGEDPGSFLMLKSASWRNATTFEQIYEADYVTVNTSTVDVAVNGAQDTLGVPQQPGFQANVFDITPYVIVIPPPSVIDMRGVLMPEDVFVTPAGGGRIITDADVGKTVEFIIRYDIPTDYAGCGGSAIVHDGLCLNLVFTNSAGTPLTLTNPKSEWQSRSRYKVSWTIADGNEDLSSINVRVAGGVGRRDDTNIKNTDTDLVGVFSIDTKNPSVSAVTPSPAVLRSSPAQRNGGGSFQRAGELFTITITFSEPMDTTSTPLVSFPNHPAVAAVLTPTSGSWTDSTHYAQTFVACAGSVNAPAVDVLVTGARDAHGNLQIPLLLAGVFAVALGVAAAAAVPALSTWGLVLLCAALAGMGGWLRRV
jgi:hypothetical protein